MKARFVRYQWENSARTIATFFFEPEFTYRYQAGQYAILQLPHDTVDNRGTQRTMTLSSSPDDELLAFTMKIYHTNSSSFKQALLDIKPGHEITIFESLGDLVLPLSPTIPLVFIAGGIGIASFTGMTTWLAEHNDKRDIQLHYVVARSEDVVLQQPFDNYEKTGRLTRYIYGPNDPRLTGQTILNTAQPHSLFYLSGTEKLVMALTSELLAGGVPRGRIVFDYFDGYSEL